MPYSYSRTCKMLALVRIVTGIVFILVGYYKVSSIVFARQVFPGLLDRALELTAASWIHPVLQYIISFGPSRIAISVGFFELFIGVALVLGLVVRVATLFGMVYTFGLLVSSWNQSEGTLSMLQTGDHQFRNLFPFLVMLLLGSGHAGETWGLGALYHHHRMRRLSDLSRLASQANESRPEFEGDEFVASDSQFDTEFVDEFGDREHEHEPTLRG